MNEYVPLYIVLLLKLENFLTSDGALISALEKLLLKDA